jgi:hypothetical protein
MINLKDKKNPLRKVSDEDGKGFPLSLIWVIVAE